MKNLSGGLCLPCFTRSLIVCLFLLLSYAAFGEQITGVANLLGSDGLSSQRVFSLVEGKDGAIWISTRTGVDRYNGRIIKNYSLKGDFYCGDLAGRYILLYTTDNGDIYAYDNLGSIYKYSDVYDRFEQIDKLSSTFNGNIHLNKVCPTKDLTLYCLTEGLYKRTNDGQPLQPVVKGLNVSDAVKIGNTLYAATTTGLMRIEGPQAKPVTSLPKTAIQSLFYLKDKNALYVGTFNDGLWKLNLTDLAAQKIAADNHVFNNPVRAIVRLNNDDLAVGIDGGGVYLVSIAGDAARLLIDTSDNKDYWLQGNGVYALLPDTWGNLWVGSYTGGVSNVRFSKAPLQHIVHRQGIANSIANNNVNAIEENPADGSLWFATDKGLSINRGTSWEHTLPGYVCLSVCATGSGNMLVGTYGEGFFLLDANGNVKQHFTKKNGTSASNYFFSIERDKEGDIWVGSIDGYLMHFNPQLKLQHTYILNTIYSIVPMSGSEVAVGTVDGFYVVNKGSRQITQYASAQEQLNNDVSAYIVPMLYNGNKTMWLGTEGGGLSLYDMATRKTLRNYKTAQGLPSDDVYGLERDSKGRIWISTGKGVAVLTDTLISAMNYLNLGGEYNKNASTKLKTGEIVFGSTWGALRFSPLEIGDFDYKASLHILSINVEGLDKDRQSDELEDIMEGLRKGHVSLAYDRNSFIVDFECLNLKYQDDIGYRYKLEGYDKDFSRNMPFAFAHYKNVAPGSYVLKVCAVKLSDGSVIDSCELRITVSSPWWYSWWAWLIYLLVIGVIIYLSIRYKLSLMRKKQDVDKIRFFINTAHDIRTPVTLALAPLEDLQAQEELSENGAYLLGLARQNMRKLNSMTTQLLEFEKLDWNKTSLNLVPVNLNHVLTGEVASFRNVCEKKDVTLTASIPDEALCINGDVSLLEMTFDNLISNACKYTPQGGKISITLSEHSNKVRVEIADTGIGITDEGKKRIFTEVYRDENARLSGQPGTGFGLLQVKRIVQALNGTIAFRSEPDKGTTFVLTFDRVHAEAYNEVNKHHESALLSEFSDDLATPQTEASPNAQTLLIIEDNDDLRAYLGKTFSVQYNVVLQPNADDAMEYLKTGYPDLIISDIMMPGTQGDVFCQQVKNNPETAGIPIILLTAKTDHDAHIQGLKKGADDYIPKPFSSEILRLKVAGLLENRARMRMSILKDAMNQAAQPAPEPTQPEAEPAALPETSASDRAFVRKVTDILLANIADTDFSIDALCKEMAMSRTLFYNRLKSLTGKAPQDFIRLLRLEKAAELLRQGMPVNEVSLQTGFVNPKYFATVFKKHFGVQPSKYTA